MKSKKYCPNCLEICSESPYGGYACSPCGILQYATGILFDLPDKEKSRQYKIRKLLRPYMAYDVSEEKMENLIKKLEELMPPLQAILN